MLNSRVFVTALPAVMLFSILRSMGRSSLRCQKACNAAAPNDAHLALAEYDVPVITMNVDGLHQKARSRHILAIHGTLPDIVLYDDPAPLYEVAHNWVFQLPGRGLLPDSRNLLLYQHLRAAQAGGAQKGSGCVRNRPRCGASGPRFPSEGGYSGLHFRAILGKKSIHIRDNLRSVIERRLFYLNFLENRQSKNFIV